MACGDVFDERLIEFVRCRLAYAHRDHDPGGRKTGETAARHQRIRVTQSHYHPPDPCLDDGVSTRRGFPCMTARLQIDVQYRPTRLRTGLLQGMHFRMRTTKALMVPLSHDCTVFDEYTAHEWIGAHQPESSSRQFQRLLHVLLIDSGVGCHRGPSAFSPWPTGSAGSCSAACA